MGLYLVAGLSSLDTSSLCLVAAMSPLEWLTVILQVCLGLGAVIFVHELGHFAVAKMCGVKCEKFFIGFDIGGYKISRKWGDTEYGIGILPLGGYVKMLGQDDNPANITEQVRESQVSGESKIATTNITGPDGERYAIDSRSYLAKSVPQRMAIISAGVVMNVIFAVVFAVIAYGIGVPYVPCIVTKTTPGSAAWQAGIQSGDEVTAIAGKANPAFRDLLSGVVLGDVENGIPFTMRSAATDVEETIVLRPNQDSGLAKVGIFPPSSLRLAKTQPVAEATPAASASAKFEGGDEIIQVNGEPVNDFREYSAQLVKHMGEPLEITVRRGGVPPKENRFGPLAGGEEVTITVQAQPMRRLGLVMEMGKIVAVQQGSPAAAGGVQPGDFMVHLSADDDRSDDDPTANDPFADPIKLPEQLRKIADATGEIQLTLRRSSASGEGRQATEQINVPLRRVTWIDSSWVPNDPLSAPALGVAYRVLNRVGSVVLGSPAALAELKSGDVITKAEFIYAKKTENGLKPIKFGSKGNHNWPRFMELLQSLSNDDQVKLTYQQGDVTRDATLTPVAITDRFVAERGFVFTPIRRIRTATTFGEQLRLGYEETVSSLGIVFRFLKKLGTQVPITALGGPVTIVKAAGISAFEGGGKLLVFLTILSANLAVINFLPIPLLDGGHMVFLAWEGFRGRPASERFVVALHTVGFVFIVSLMLFVITLDIRRLIGLG